MLALAFNIQPVEASGTIYIRVDGSVEPDTTPISSVDNITYTFTGNIYDEIVVERDNISVNGAGYTLHGEGGTGLNLTGRSNVTIKNMEIKGFAEGIYLYDSSNNTISGNNITNNDDGIWFDYSSNNNIISGNTITNNGDGIWLGRSSNNTISGNNITNNDWFGIDLYDSSNNIISRNTITNDGDGIELGGYPGGSSNNIISGNNITNNVEEGIVLHFSSNNTISGNNITNNWSGIYLADDSSNNLIYHNNFMNNTYQVIIMNEQANTWDDGYPSGGSYWSDYNGTDTCSGQYQNETGSDGLGDTSYTIDVNNQDHYPLMGMFADFNATSEYHVQTICNSSISDFQFDGTAICFNVTGENGTTGFCRICIPTALMNVTYKVYVNGTEVPHTLLPCSNSTHSYLYFTYNLSIQEVIIISEFPAWTSMLLILFVLTVALAIYKRRLPKKTPIS